MYIHTAGSIKETQDKMFVSQSEKDKWNLKAEPSHIHDDRYYNKKDIDIVLDSSMVDISSNHINVEAYSGYTKGTEILGRTVQYSEDIKITPTYEDGAIYLENGNEGNISDSEGNPLPRYRIQEYIPIQIGDVITIAASAKANFIYYDKNKQYLGYHTKYCNSFTVNVADACFLRYYGDESVKDKVCYIKRTNLSDIRSVGEKREDAGYEFEIISNGRNLLNCDMVIGVWNYETGEPIFTAYENNIACTSKIKIGKGEYLFDVFGDLDHWVLIYDEFGGYTNKFVFVSRNKPRFTMPIDGYITFYGVGAVGTGAMTHNYAIYRTEIGSDDSLPQYQKYTEYTRQKVILPMQLEGIGDVSDRLFVREDGIVCVEKWIKSTSYISENSEWDINIFEADNDPNNKTYLFSVRSEKIEHSRPLICDKLPYLTDGNWVIDVESVYKPEDYSDGKIHNTIHVRLAKDRFGPNPTRNDFRNFINSVNFKYITKTPEIIELGHISDISIPLVDGVNNIMTNSQIHHNIKCEIPVSLSANIESQTEKIVEMENKIDNIKTINHTNSNMVIEFSNGQRTINDSIDGYATDIIIEGNTYLSAINSKLFDLNTEDFVRLTDPNVTSTNGIITVNKPEGHESYINLFSKRKLFNVKPNTVYTYIVEVYENSLVRTDGLDHVAVFCGGNSDARENDIEKTIFKQSDYPKIYGRETGMFKFLITTRDDVMDMDDDVVGDRIFISAYCTGTIKFKYTLIEGDHMNNDSIKSAFPGICSVSNDCKLTLKSSNKNLFNYKEYNRQSGEYTRWEVSDNKIRMYTDGGERKWTYKYFVMDLKPNTKYRFSMDAPHVVSGRSAVCVRTLYRGEIVGNATFFTLYEKDGNTKEFKTPDFIGGDFVVCAAFYATTDVVEVGDVTYSNISVTEIYEDQNVDIVTNKTHEQNLTLSEPLKGIPGGPKDTIEKINGEYYVIRRCGEITFDNSNANVWIESEPDNNNEETTVFKVSRTNAVWNGRTHQKNSWHGMVTNNTYKHNAWKADTKIQCCGCAHNFDFRVLNSNLETLDIEGFRKYISNNPITLVYELENPIIESIGTNIDMRMFTDRTDLIVKTGYITPKVKLTLPLNLSNTIKSISDKIYSIETSRYNMIKTLLQYSFDSDVSSYRFQMATYGTRSVSSYIDHDLFNMYKFVIEYNDYDRHNIEEKIDFYVITSRFSIEMANELFNTIDKQCIDIIETK